MYQLDAWIVSPAEGSTYHTGSAFLTTASVGFFGSHRIQIWSNPNTTLYGFDWYYSVGYDSTEVTGHYGPGGPITTNDVGYWSNSDSTSKTTNVMVGNRQARASTAILLPDSPWIDSYTSGANNFTVVAP